MANYSMGNSGSSYGPGGSYGGNQRSLSYSGPGTASFSSPTSSFSSYNGGGGGNNNPTYAEGGPMGSAGSRPSGPADYTSQFGGAIDRYLSTFPMETLPFQMIPVIGQLMGVTALLNALGIQGEVDPMGNAGSPNSPDRNAIMSAAINKFGNTEAGAGQFSNLVGQTSNFSNFMRELDQALVAQKGDYGKAAQARGYDYDTFGDVFNPELDRQRTAVMNSIDQYVKGDGLLDTALDPYKFAFSSHITPGTGEGVLSAEEQRRRAQYGQQIDAYAPTGFDYNLLPDTYDDQAINDLLGVQHQNAQRLLENDQKRNLLTAPGYSAALADLTNQQNKGNATLQTMGGGYLNTGRSDLRNIVNTGKQAASSYTLGSNFDAGQYQTQLNDYLNTFSSTLPGRMENDGGTLINYLGALQKGGVAQGTQNPGGTSVNNYLQNMSAGAGAVTNRNVQDTGRF